MREALGDGDFLRGAGGQAIQANLEATAAFLEAGMRAGAFRPQDSRQLALSIVGLHAYYFPTAATSGRFLGGDIFAPGLLRRRRAAIREQVRALCVPAAPPSRAGRRSR